MTIGITGSYKMSRKSSGQGVFGKTAIERDPY